MRWHTENKIKFLNYKDEIILALLLLLVVFNLLNTKGERVYLLTDGKTEDSPKLELFCRSFFEQIISRNLQKEMVEPDIFEILILDNYKILNLLGHEKILYSRAENSSCSVIIKDRVGLRRFDLNVNISENYPLFYRVQKIDEPTIEG